jgi:DNA-binding NarL/FixJ family response regulator
MIRGRGSSSLLSKSHRTEKPDLGILMVRILVVEDFEEFRRCICSTLEKQPELQIVGEASDGLEAVSKAEQLQPDLILLDIGLPTLNGIEAARRIRELSPKSRILFVSQETSARLIREGFSVGALGYVVKEHAGSELLVAVEAICEGRQFVSKGLSERGFILPPDAQDPDLHNEESHLSLVRKEEFTRKHEVQFYSDDASFQICFARFVETALGAGRAAVVVVAESHRENLIQRLRGHGVDTATAIEQGSLIVLDVAETLATIMVNDLIDPVRFLKVTGDLLAASAKASKGKHPRVVVCGECAPTLWAQGRADAAVQLERLWDQTAGTHSVDILCGYVSKRSELEADIRIYERICAEHSAVCHL